MTEMMLYTQVSRSPVIPHYTNERRPGRLVDADADKDFYISYTSADTKWAHWIARQLEQEQNWTILQAWDFQPGMTLVLEMNKAAKVAHCTLVVLSPDHLTVRYTQPEWADAFRPRPEREAALLPVRLRKCEVDGLLGSLLHRSG